MPEIPKTIHISLHAIDEYPLSSSDWDYLSDEEVTRATHYKFPEDQNRFVIARSLLKQALSKMSHQDPKHIKFSYGKYGKPRLSDPGLDDLHFNLSHSENLIGIVISNTHPVGIDLQKIKPLSYLNKLVSRYCSNEEQLYLKTRHPDEQLPLFYKLWCQKEGISKALGMGIQFGFKTIDLNPELYSQSIPNPGDCLKSQEKCLNVHSCLLTVPDDYCAALSWIDH